jgi:hypothetical protein
MVNFDWLNTLSTSQEVAGIERISNAIFARRRRIIRKAVVKVGHLNDVGAGHAKSWQEIRTFLARGSRNAMPNMNKWVPLVILKSIQFNSSWPDSQLT